jgi:hypothetical protein
MANTAAPSTAFYIFLTRVGDARGDACRSVGSRTQQPDTTGVSAGADTIGGNIGRARAQQENTMKSFAYVGALVLAFVLGGVSTLVGFPGYQQAAMLQAVATISPAEMHRSAGPLPETFVENYI